MLKELFQAFVIPSLAGSCLAVMITLARPVTKKLFGYSWHYYIWLAVLITMLLPVQFSVSPNNNIPAFPSQEMSNTNAVDISQTNTATPLVMQTAPKTTAMQQGTEFVKRIFDNRINIFAFLWLAGAIFLLLINLIGYIRLIIKMRKNSEIISCPSLSKHTNKKMVVRAWENLSSPFMAGLFKPTLVLPETELTEEQLDNILRHEMTHFKRKDILYKWFAVFVRCLHWYNPVVWYVVRQINIECEISCDLSVVRQMSKDEKASYINTILTLLSSGKSKSIPFTTGMTGSKKILKRRFIMIRNKKAASKFMSILSAVIAVIMLSATVFSSGVMANGILNHNISDWSTEDIQKAKDYLIINDDVSISDYKQSITRYLFSELAANTLVYSGVTLAGYRQQPFADVSPQDTFITALYDMGIITGKNEAEFAPNDTITREEAAAILYRMRRYVNLSNQLPDYRLSSYIFADDHSISEWAKESVYSIQLANIMSGIGNDLFDPQGLLTVEQAVTAMVRLYEQIHSAYQNAEELEYNQLDRLQESVDNGHKPWRLDPNHVILVFVNNKGIGGGEIMDVTEDNFKCSATYVVNNDSYSVELFKPIQQDEHGIWVVRVFKKNNL